MKNPDKMLISAVVMLLISGAFLSRFNSSHKFNVNDCISPGPYFEDWYKKDRDTAKIVKIGRANYLVHVISSYFNNSLEKDVNVSFKDAVDYEKVDCPPEFKE